MKTFLSAVAKDLVQRNIDFAQTAIVFPNKRASLFFDRELYDILQKPFWSPNYISIQDIWSKFSELQIAEPVLLNYKLYEVYKTFINNAESFDDFYYWGEMLLRDFDDIDKHLVKGKQLFSNIKDIKDLEDPLQYLTKNQLEVLNQFFIHFSAEKSTEVKDRFLQIWSVLGDIYEDFRTKLSAQNMAYEGMLTRNAIENLNQNGIPDLAYENYIFVGFNVLNTCEEQLFEHFRKSGKALFYWDYDNAYLQNSNHEAGIFMRSNITRFGNALNDPELFNNFQLTKAKKNIRFIASSTENAQARYVNQWLCEQEQEASQPTETAIVLCNEQLLIPVISATSNVSDVNITMGYPIQNTPIFALVNLWIDLQVNGYRRQELSGFIEHPYISPIVGNAYIQEFKNTPHFFPKAEELHRNDERLKILFEKHSKPESILEGLKALLHFIVKEAVQKEDKNTDVYENLYQEASFRILEEVQTLLDLLHSGQLELSNANFQRLLRQVLSSVSVPFLGEPVLGTQIMGVLETRNLDFKNLIMLSVNEGILPKSANEGSFVPYSLRRAFGMTTIEHKNAVFAYYFFRLIQRAENICLLYNTATEGSNKGEMSRFMTQLMVETDFQIEHQTLTPDNVTLPDSRFLSVSGSPDIADFLIRKFSSERNFLSPTAINAFISCKLKFYLRYVAGLYPPKDICEDVDAAMLGTLFHRSAELLFREIGGLTANENKEFPPIEHVIPVKAEQLAPYLQGKNMEHLVDQAFQIDYFKAENYTDTPQYTGNLLVRRQMLLDFLKRLIKLDLELGSFSISGLEKHIVHAFNINGHPVRVGGYIDRLDRVNGYTRIIDYKTGGKKNVQKAEKISSLFEENETRDKNNLQTLLYSLIIKKQDPEAKVLPCILHINSVFSDSYSPEILDGDFDDIQEPFEEFLTATLKQIFDKDTVFCATQNLNNCKYCDYLNLCRREVFGGY